MTITAYRLTKAKYADSAFSGEGSRLYGGRWSPPGVPLVYLADSLPLAVLETLVHLERSPVLNSFVYFEARFDEKHVKALQADGLPEGWKSHPESAVSTSIGQKWAFDKASLVLRVPSAIVPQNHNYLLNPAHPDIKQVAVTGPWPFELDERLG